MRRFAIAATPADLAGHWYLAATTRGMFEYRPHIATAHLLVGPVSDRGQRSFGEFSTGNRTHRFRGRIPPVRDEQGTFSWRGALGTLFVTRSNWLLARSAGGDVFSAYHPSSLLLNGGTVVLSRTSLSIEASLRIVRSEYAALGLAPRDNDELSWRSRPAAELLRAAANRWQEELASR